MAKRSRRYEVKITLRGEAAKRVDDLLKTGLYGTNRNKTAEIVLMEGLMIKGQETDSDYRIILQMYGYPAYVINNLVNVIGNDRSQVLEQIVLEWMSGNWKRLSDMGLSIQDAEKKGYLPKRK